MRIVYSLIEVPRVGEGLFGCGPGLLDETEIGLDQRLGPAGPRLGMRMPRLDGELVSGSRVRERQLPATGEPLDQDERPEGHLPAHLVASFLCLRLELLQDLAGSVEVAHHHQPPPEHVDAG